MRSWRFDDHVYNVRPFGGVLWWQNIPNIVLQTGTYFTITRHTSLPQTFFVFWAARWTTDSALARRLTWDVRAWCPGRGFAALECSSRSHPEESGLNTSDPHGRRCRPDRRGQWLEATGLFGVARAAGYGTVRWAHYGTSCCSFSRDTRSAWWALKRAHNAHEQRGAQTAT